MADIDVVAGSGLVTVEDFEGSPTIWQIGTFDLGTVWINNSGSIQGTRCATATTTGHLAPAYFNGVATVLPVPLDLSDSDAFLWLWVSMIKPLVEKLGLQSDGGLTIRLYSGAIVNDGDDLAPDSSNTCRGYAVGGRDTLIPAWNRIVINPANMTPYESIDNGGTWDLSNITMIGFVAKKTITGYSGYGYHMMLDAIHTGRGIQCYSTNSTDTDRLTLAEISDYTETTDRAWGIVRNYKGVWFVNGEIKIGDTAQSIYFEIENEVVVFEVQSNYTGAYSQSSINYWLHGITAVNSTIADIKISSSVLRAEAFGWFFLYFPAASNVVVNMPSDTVIGASSLVFHAGHTISGKFDNCGRILLNGATLTDFIITGYQGTHGALLYSPASIVLDGTFIGNDRAIEHDVAGSYDYDNITFSDNTYNVHNSSPGTVDITRINGGDVEAGFVINSNGGSINLLGARAAIIMQVVDDVTYTPISNANILLMRNSDSAVMVYSSTDENGYLIQNIVGDFPMTLVGWARQSDLIDDDYENKDISGTVTENGLTLLVSLHKS